MPIQALIVDDEAHARTRLRNLLQKHSDFRVLGECANGFLALASIQTQKPDVVFLDIKMPRMNGFELCRRLPPTSRPLIVFVTAFDQHALQAFEVHAIDYLLKPFDADRFDRTLNHIRERLIAGSAPGSDQRLSSLLEDIAKGPHPPRRLVFKTEGKLVLVKMDDLDWVEADGNYLRLHVGPVTHHVRETLGAMEAQLPTHQFLRISRSTIVNLDRIRELQVLFYGDYSVLLKDGTKLSMSRNYRERIESMMNR